MPQWKIPHGRPRVVGVMLFERFSNHCLANAVEPMRAANDMLGWRAYDWHVLTLDGRPVASSSGLPVMPAGPIAEALGGDALMVMPSYGYRDLATAACGAALRSAAGRYRTLIGLDTGSWLLAAAGLLDGRAATIHQAEFDAFAERFGRIDVRRDRWVEDGDRITAGGAMAAFDLVLHLIGRAHGTAVTLDLAALFLKDDAPARMRGLGAASGGRHVRRALDQMEANLEVPLGIAEIARRAGCGQRDLERRFAVELGATPRTVYRRLRLSLARRLVATGEMRVGEIAVRCGYGDASAFTRAFRREFGAAPRFMG